MQKSGIISMENLFDVKAPLASFDTVDLGDEDRGDHTLELMPVTPEESIAESVESQSSNNSDSQHVDCELNIEIPTALEKPVLRAIPAEIQSCADETDSTKGENTGTGTTESTTSSENNAAGGDILQRLKLKSKKHKETESKVKYQHIENTSDLSDQEKSPLPDLKLASTYKICDSDTDSSDSDRGYIRSGYIAALKGTKKGSKKKNKRAVKVIQNYNLSGSESTPNASPKIFRPILPPPLSEEERAQQSKRKAYEKRLQRLQVTTTPIERPRSTTPIDIFGLEEYANISSPEKTPVNGNFEKLKITLPPDEFHQKGQSPRKSSKLTESQDPHVFTFNEDLLFTHTKSALVIQDEKVKGQSPKKILIPPTLSPALSPRSQRCSTALNLSPRSPRYFYNPSQNRIISPSHVGENWAKFEDEIPIHAGNAKPESKERYQDSDTSPGLKESIARDIHSLDAEDKVLNEEEILTINVKVVADKKVCDIKCESVAKSTESNVTNNINHTNTLDCTSSDITTVTHTITDSGQEYREHVLNDFGKSKSNEVNTVGSIENIWETQESACDKDNKLKENLENSATESNIGESLKEIIDSAFKDETFKLDYEEKGSICDTLSREKEISESPDRIEKLDVQL